MMKVVHGSWFGPRSPRFTTERIMWNTGCLTRRTAEIEWNETFFRFAESSVVGWKNQLPWFEHEAPRHFQSAASPFKLERWRASRPVGSCHEFCSVFNSRNMGCRSLGRECTSLASSRCMLFGGILGWRGGILVASLVEQVFLKRLIEDDVNRLKPYVKNGSLIASWFVLFQPMCPCAKGIERHTWSRSLSTCAFPRPFLVWRQLAGVFAKGLYHAAMAGTIATFEHWAFVGSHSEAAAHHAGLLVEGWSNKHLVFHCVFLWVFTLEDLPPRYPETPYKGAKEVLQQLQQEKQDSSARGWIHWTVSHRSWQPEVIYPFNLYLVLWPHNATKRYKKHCLRMQFYRSPFQPPTWSMWMPVQNSAATWTIRSCAWPSRGLVGFLSCNQSLSWAKLWTRLRAKPSEALAKKKQSLSFINL